MSSPVSASSKEKNNTTRPSVVVMWLLVWVLFRTMFGAGMIKVRADPAVTLPRTPDAVRE